MNDSESMIQCTRRVPIFRFPLEIYNYQIYNKFLSNSIKTNKCLPIYNTIQVCFIMNSLHKRTWCNKYQSKIQKLKCAGTVQLYFLSPRAGSLDEVWMLLHHTPRLKRFHGLLSMSSCTVCPCFCIALSPSWHPPLGDFSILPGIQNIAFSWSSFPIACPVCTPSEASVQLVIASATGPLVLISSSSCFFSPVWV
jgi:hypothetical protein